MSDRCDALVVLDESRRPLLYLAIPASLFERVVRGQFAGYRDEAGVAPDSDVETFVALEAEIGSWRWAGVPFSIRAITELAVQPVKGVAGAGRHGAGVGAEHEQVGTIEILEGDAFSIERLEIQVGKRVPGGGAVGVEAHVGEHVVQREVLVAVDGSRGLRHGGCSVRWMVVAGLGDPPNTCPIACRHRTLIVVEVVDRVAVAAWDIDQTERGGTDGRRAAEQP